MQHSTGGFLFLGVSTQQKVAFHTLGCKLNYSETSSLQREFERKGFDVVPLGQPADLVVINTCTVTDNADVECRKIVRRALKGAPNASIAVTGCYAQLKPEEIASIDGVSAVFGTAEKSTIAEHVQEILDADAPQIFVKDLSSETEFAGARTTANDARTRAYLKLQDGCDYTCTFCTIPMARGSARELGSTGVREQLREIESEGFHEVVLSGINLGEYAAATGERFIDVVRMIDDMKPKMRVRVSSLEPNTIKPELIDLIAGSDVFVPHLHIPLQSGSAAILKKMRRRYSPEQYRAVIERVYEKMPHAAVGIDVIVGFPGETEELFEESMAFIKSLNFTYLHVFTYSERANTPAASYPNPVPMKVRKARTARLRALSEERRMAHYQRNVGEVRSVIPEHYDPDRKAWSAFTENYVKVWYEAPELIIRGPHSVLLTELVNDTVRAVPAVVTQSV